MGGGHSGGVRSDGCEVLSMWAGTGGCWAIGSLAAVGMALLEVWEVSIFVCMGGWLAL